MVLKIMYKLNRSKPITKTKLYKIFINILIGIWFMIPILVVRPFKKIYFAKLQTSRIGHFILDTEILLSRIHIDQNNSRNKILVIWIPESFICNKYVYTIWKQKIHIFPHNRVTSAILLTAMYLEKMIKIKTTYRFIGWDGYLPYVHLLEITPTIFSMPNEDKESCIKTLKLNGIDTDKQWVCILARDSKYLADLAPDLDWEYNSYRNSDISTYKIAAEYLAEKNIMTFRMGLNHQYPFYSSKSNLVIDYANSGWRSDKLDIFLSMNCFFFISSGTGLDSVSVATRSPLLLVNLSQPLHLFRSKNNFLFIMKYFFYKKKNIFLSPNDFYKIGTEEGFTVDNPLHLRSQDFEKLEIQVIDNTDVEIKDATIEMYESLTNKDIQEVPLTAMQNLFWEKFPNVPKCDNHISPSSRIGKDFIRQNQWLLDRNL